MWLSKLTIFGFKSFAEKTELQFEPGITAVVGPNGGGKTNLVDSIRWALGEQSARLLRGERMEDLIFKGSSIRKPLSLAEVTLTFSDNHGDLPIDYEEVSITRRLFRSGESEYLLNKTPCRLRDITDLFLDTGLGAEPYAIIDQQAINSLVNAKPQDLRVLLEEAAGVMKYKTRKKAALHKLEATQQNLLRINDIIREVERQLTSLKRQANKAERYKLLQEQISSLRLYLKYHESLHLQDELNRLTSEERALKDAISAKEAASSRLEALLEEKRLRDLEGEKALAAAQEHLYAIRGQITRHEAELVSRRSLLHELGRRVQDESTFLERVHLRVGSLQEEESREASAFQALEDESVRLQAKLEELAQQEGEYGQELQRIGRDFEEKRRQTIEHTLVLSGRRNELSRLKERHRVLLLQAGRSKTRMEEAERSLHEKQTEEERLKEEVRSLSGERSHLSREQEALSEQIMEQEERLQDLALHRGLLQEEIGRLKSRMESLKELEATFAGAGERGGLFLQECARATAQLSGLKGTLFEALEVEARYERAIEALLAEALHGIVTDSVEDALAALSFLKERSGRATLLFPVPPEKSQEWIQRLQEGLRAQGPFRDGIEGMAVDFVRVKGNGASPGLVLSVLGEGIIVRDVQTAVALASALPSPFAIATLDGEVLSHRGTLTGGAPSPSGPLSRRREIRELSRSLEAKEAELSTLLEEEASAKATLAELERALESLEERLEATQFDLRDREKDLSQTRADEERLKREVALLSSEWQNMTDEIEGLQSEIEGATRDLQEAEAEERRLQEEHLALEAEKVAVEERRGELLREVTEAKIEAGSLFERREGVRRTLARLAEEFEGARQEAKRLEEDLTSLGLRRRELEGALQALQEALEGFTREEAVAQGSIQRHQEARQVEQEKIKRLEEELKPLRKEAAELRATLSTLSSRKAELTTTLSLLEEELHAESHTSLEELSTRYAHETLDPSQAQVDLEAFKEKLENLGPANLAALEEYEALSGRHTFLTSQAEDLEASIQTLKATSAEIEKTIKRLFEGTLAKVNEHFDHLWKRLFSGGSAELRFVQTENGEEPGLEMAISIPGKRTSNTALLSSGERALAALALLLALFQVRPSPFCLLDEVDAPLDDVNVEHFAALLRELSAHHQVIVITHNKRTMEVADALYGVTQEDGTSRLISVKISEVESPFRE
ncbi:MAG: chromosome segregation protein SMC [candidate division NC10 bacterium]|nr:chromosome segregation protein SMC [candidate division NC10 bacterium]